MYKTIRRVTSLDEQEAETDRYWQSRPVGERLIAVVELSEAAYAFAQGFRENPAHVDQERDVLLDAKTLRKAGEAMRPGAK